MRLTTLRIGLWLSGLAVPVASSMAQGGAHAVIYTCMDKDGHRLIADRPIPQCADREQRVLRASGQEHHRMGPALTETEMGQRLETRRQVQFQQQRVQDARRRDAALLARYPHRVSHELARRTHLQRIEAVQTQIAQRLQLLGREKVELQKTLTRYAAHNIQAPARLQTALEKTARAQQEQRLLLLAHTEEAVRLSQRFDAELLRLEPMWQQQSDYSSGIVIGQP